MSEIDVKVLIKAILYVVGWCGGFISYLLLGVYIAHLLGDSSLVAPLILLPPALIFVVCVMYSHLKNGGRGYE